MPTKVVAWVPIVKSGGNGEMTHMGNLPNGNIHHATPDHVVSGGAEEEESTPSRGSTGTTSLRVDVRRSWNSSANSTQHQGETPPSSLSYTENAPSTLLKSSIKKEEKERITTLPYYHDDDCSKAVFNTNRSSSVAPAMKRLKTTESTSVKIRENEYNAPLSSSKQNYRYDDDRTGPSQQSPQHTNDNKRSFSMINHRNDENAVASDKEQGCMHHDYNQVKEKIDLMTTMQSSSPDSKAQEESSDKNKRNIKKKYMPRKTFDQWCAELALYKKKFNLDTIVRIKTCPEYTSLGRWCQNIRNSHKNMMRGIKTNIRLTPEKIKKLDELGFHWGPQHRTFDEWFQELLAYKSRFGHVNVPVTQKNEYSPLGSWCADIRQKYKDRTKNGNMSREGRLSESNILDLQNIGFQWTMNQSFEERLQELREFKEKYGHCNVPKPRRGVNENRSLANWCSILRRSYKAIKRGDVNKAGLYKKLSEENIRTLEAMGFKWACPHGPSHGYIGSITERKPTKLEKISNTIENPISEGDVNEDNNNVSRFDYWYPEEAKKSNKSGSCNTSPINSADPTERQIPRTKPEMVRLDTFYACFQNVSKEEDEQ